MCKDYDGDIMGIYKDCLRIYREYNGDLKTGILVAWGWDFGDLYMGFLWHFYGIFIVISF